MGEPRMPKLPLRAEWCPGESEDPPLFTVDADGLALTPEQVAAVNARLSEHEKMRKALAFLAEHAMWDPDGAVTQDEFNDVMADASELGRPPPSKETP